MSLIILPLMLRPLLPPSLALSGAFRSNGIHFVDFFCFLKVFFVALERPESELPSRLRRLRADDMAASAKVRGREEAVVAAGGGERDVGG
jgi:hypothetical protein